MTDNEILQRILGELKSIKESQAVLERDVKDVRADQQVTHINIDKLSRNQASIEQSQQAIRSSQLKVELEQYPRITAALDGVLAGIEKNQAQDERVTALERKTDNHDTRLWALEQKAI